MLGGAGQKGLSAQIALVQCIQAICECTLEIAVHDHVTSDLLERGGGPTRQHAWHHACWHEKLPRCNEKILPSCMQAWTDVRGQQTVPGIMPFSPQK